MGLQASIEIKYFEVIEFKSFLEILLKSGWSIEDDKSITYLINDDFDWERCDHKKEADIIDLMNNRFVNNQIAGIALTLTNGTGCLFHFIPEKKEVMILLNINRIKINDSQFTDYTFYAKYLKCILDKSEVIKYTDVI